MSPETTEHLVQVETVIREVKRLLAVHGYPSDLRTVLVIGFIAQVIEHHEAILLLIRQGKVGSAFALARAGVEAMYRGLWVNLAATDTEAARFERRDDVGLTMTELARAIDTAYEADGFFMNLPRQSPTSGHRLSLQNRP